MGALNKLRRLDGSTVGITIPKDDLRLDGILNEDGELVDEHIAHIDRTGECEWTVELVEDL